MSENSENKKIEIPGNLESRKFLTDRKVLYWQNIFRVFNIILCTSSFNCSEPKSAKGWTICIQRNVFIVTWLRETLWSRMILFSQRFWSQKYQTLVYRNKLAKITPTVSSTLKTLLRNEYYVIHSDQITLDRVKTRLWVIFKNTWRSIWTTTNLSFVAN